MRFREYRFLVRSDLHRYAGGSAASSFAYHLVLEPGFKHSFWMRTCAFAKARPLLRMWLFPLAWLVLRHHEHKYGISISYRTQVGSGLYIGHFGGIVVSPKAVIGKNCNLSQQVTLGTTNRGERTGAPTIGDNVYIGPGSKVIGNVRVGDRAAIGANCVVTRDVPDDAVVVGVPGRVISSDGSAGYVNNTDYE
jgi:serine O-acetyltransferase